MAKHSFYIQSKKASGKASLYTMLRVNGRTIKVNSSISVDIEAWNKSLKSAAALMRYNSSKEGKKVVAAMAQASETIDRCLANGVTEGREIASTIAGVLGVDTDRKIKEAEKAKDRNLLNYIHKFNEGIAKGDITKDKKKTQKFSKSSICIFNEIEKKLRDFLGKKADKLTFDDIDAKFAQSFQNYLLSDMMVGGAVSYISYLRALLGRAAKEGVNTNSISLVLWSMGTIDKEDRATQTFLTESEIDGLYNLPLVGIEAAVRDTFLIGTFLGQRYSDYSRITKSMFDFDDDVITLTITQKKVKKELTLPIINDRLLAILKRNDFTVPTLGMARTQFADTHLKKIMHDFAHTEAGSSLMETEKTLLSNREKLGERNYIKLLHKDDKDMTSSERRTFKARKQYAQEHGNEGKDQLYMRDESGNVLKYRWELVSTHVARRSFVTNGMIDGIDHDDLRAFTGHSSDKMLENYDKLAAKYKAKLLARKLMERKNNPKTIDISAAQ